MILSISVEALGALVRAGLGDPEVPGGKAHLFDLRAPAAYQTGHIPGALHTPHDQLVRWIPQRAATHELVILIDDDGAAGGDARRAAAELAHHWFRRVRYIKGGMRAYAAAGQPTATGGATGADAASHEGTTAERHASSRVDWATPDDTVRPRMR